MKNNAFTLVEILGSLFVITVIALITAPIVLRILNKSKKETFEKTVNGIVDAIRMDNAKKGYIETRYTLQNGKITDTDGNKIAKNGGYRGNGSFLIDDEGNLAFYVENGTWCALKEKDGKVQILDYDKATCKMGTTSTFVKYEDGTAIYYNPNTNTRCEEAEAVSTTGTKSGCMKWYAFLDTIEKDSVKMILDHNTSGNVAWNSSGNNEDGMNEVKTRLEEDTSTWKVSARLITADEVAEITGAKEALNWNSNHSPSSAWFYLDGKFGSDANWQTKVVTASSKSHYVWLYNYTYQCVEHGCEVEDNNAYPYGEASDGGYLYGYWTSDSIAESKIEAWRVFHQGSLRLNAVNNGGYCGVRPVIEVSKSIFT